MNTIEIKKEPIHNKPTSNNIQKNIIFNNNIKKQPINQPNKNKEIKKLETLKNKDIAYYNQTNMNQFYTSKNNKNVKPKMQTRIKPSISDKNILPQKVLVHSNSQQNYNITPLYKAIKRENHILPKKIEKIKRRNIDNNEDY